MASIPLFPKASSKTCAIGNGSFVLRTLVVEGITKLITINRIQPKLAVAPTPTWSKGVRMYGSDIDHLTCENSNRCSFTCTSSLFGYVCSRVIFNKGDELSCCPAGIRMPPTTSQTPHRCCESKNECPTIYFRMNWDPEVPEEGLTICPP